jgi:hypothetical protein
MLDRDFRMAPDQWRAWFASQGRADLNLLLFAIWDPIGVSDTAISAGEYENYVVDVVPYVRDDDPAGLADYLRHVATEAMGLSRSERPVDAARRVINGAHASAWIWAGRPLPGDDQ